MITNKTKVKMTQVRVMHKDGFACYDTEFEISRSDMYKLFESKFNNFTMNKDFAELFYEKYGPKLIPMFSLGKSIIKENIEHVNINVDVAPFYSETLDLLALPENIKTVNFYSHPENVTRNIPSMYTWPLTTHNEYIFWDNHDSNDPSKRRKINLYRIVAITKILHSSLDKNAYHDAVKFVDINLANIRNLESLVQPDVFRKIMSFV